MINPTLIHGDCVDELTRIPTKSVDVVITSPPYNMNLRVRNGRYCSRQIVKEISTKYANYDDNLTMDEYFNFNKKVLDECLRVSKIVFYNVQIVTGNKPAIFRLMGEYHDKIKELIIWDKVNAQPAIGESILNSQFELIIVFDSDSAITRKFNNGAFDRGSLSNHWSIKRGKKINKNHGASFPVELVDKIISNFTKEGDTVMDPFMGTGTTGVAALKSKREFIGIEIDDDYFCDAAMRIIYS